ncbi:UNVERIFIED_CONTAM: hypothetical protein Slati_2934200 [Sesamum latifolium]|uniref:Retrotransposon Copia-like N-terminal domain-containing protein n=1 Tax=Sesamum latifolium TaxID=2727402 RepID=A0AAW2VDF7_9LAMI
MSHNPLNSILEANKFDGTNYPNWLRNLRIVLDFENQTYVLGKSLPRTLPEGSLPGERLMFEKFTQWHEDNWKVSSIVLGSMSNEIQKQYKRYAVTKAFFGARMIEESSVREHGVMMLSLVEKLKDLQADFEKYEATIEKSAPSVLVGEASTSKAKGKDAGREKRKKDKTSSTTASTSSVPVTPPGGGKGKRKRVRKSKIPNDVCIYCREKGHWKREFPQLLFDESLN